MGEAVKAVYIIIIDGAVGLASAHNSLDPLPLP